MKTLDHAAAQVFIDAGCRVDGANIVGPAEVVIGALSELIGARKAFEREEFTARTGISPEWIPSGPREILKDAGWGTDREGNLVGGNYEINRAKRIIETLFEA